MHKTRSEIKRKPDSLDGRLVETEEYFKYSGTVLDTEDFQKMLSVTFLLNSAASLFELVSNLLLSVFTFNFPAWHAHLKHRFENKLSRIVSMASEKTSKASDLTFYSKYEVEGEEHLFCQFELLSSGRRWRVSLAIKNIFKRSPKTFFTFVFVNTVCW